MAKLDYEPRTLDDKIVKDGLCAVATLADNPFSQELYFVVGGIAAHSYLPSKCRRPTSDIDLAILKPLNNREDFKLFSKTVYDYLGDNGYEPKNRKGQRAFCIDFKDDKGNLFFIEFPRKNGKAFNEKAKSLKREKEYAKYKIIEGTNKTCVFSSPEDIIVPKLARGVNSIKRNPIFEKDIGYMKNLSDEEIKRDLKRIRDLRLEAILNAGDLGLTEELRFVSDLYDIRLLSELGGINEKYFRESASAWDSLKDSDERNLLARSVLPDNLVF